VKAVVVNKSHDPRTLATRESANVESLSIQSLERSFVVIVDLSVPSSAYVTTTESPLVRHRRRSKCKHDFRLFRVRILTIEVCWLLEELFRAYIVRWSLLLSLRWSWACSGRRTKTKKWGAQATTNVNVGLRGHFFLIFIGSKISNAQRAQGL